MKPIKKKKQPLVSIIVNCHNGEKYLSETLSSIIKQTYKNWELIFWDNNSSDNSKDICKKFREKRFKIFSTKSKNTLYKSRKLAINKCKGEYISFLDADDMWMKNKLKKQIKKFNSKIGLVYSNLNVLDQKNNKIKKFTHKTLPSGKITSALIRDYKMGVITVILKKSLLKKLNLNFTTKYNVIGDFDLFVKLSKYTNIEVVQEPMATYRVHGNNFSLLNEDLTIKEFEHWIKKNKNFYKKADLSELKISIRWLKIKNYFSQKNWVKFFFQIIIFCINIYNISFICKKFFGKCYETYFNFFQKKLVNR